MPWCFSHHRASALLLLAATVVDALTPLTEIMPDTEELSVFPATLRAAVTKAGVMSLTGSVVHIMGATSVEDAVDWSALCADGLTLVLAGPQVHPLAKMVKGQEIVQRKKPGQECVTVVRGLYSVGVVRDALGARHAAANPDVIVAFNADVYKEYWRRTLADLLLIRKPVIVTMYCEYEGAELSSVLGDPSAFSVSAMDEGDAYIRKRYRGDADDFLALTPAAAPLPTARMLWQFERNPNAHQPPVDCLAKPYRHGVRNSFWTAFVGEIAVAGDAKQKGHDEV